MLQSLFCYTYIRFCIHTMFTLQFLCCIAIHVWVFYETLFGMMMWMPCFLPPPGYFGLMTAMFGAWSQAWLHQTPSKLSLHVILQNIMSWWWHKPTFNYLLELWRFNQSVYSSSMGEPIFVQIRLCAILLSCSINIVKHVLYRVFFLCVHILQTDQFNSLIKITNI